MSDSETDDIDEIREQKAEELKAQTETPDEPVYVDSAADLDDVVASNDVVIADFYADWCGPCKMLDPILEEIAAETDAVVAKVDVDELQSLAQERGVQGVPTLFVYADGEQVERFVGVQEKATLVDLVEAHGA